MDLDEERVDAHRGSSSGEVGHVLGLPPEELPAPPGAWALCVASNTIG